jgi:glutathione S-transferase
MKLYYASSVCSLAVRIVLHEIRVSCEYEAVNLKTKMMENGGSYLDINPKGSVPALVLDSNEVLTENAVILQYLADRYNAVGLLPVVGDMNRYRVLEWLNFVSTDLHRYTAPLFWSSFPGDLKQHVITPILERKLSHVDEHLKDRVYLMGNEFTLGDSYLFVILIWLAILKMPMENQPHLTRYFSEMKSRSAVEKALQEEGIADLVLS